MSSLYVNTVNETQKLLYRKKNLVFLIFAAVIPAGAAALLAFGQTSLGIFAVSSASFPVLMLGLFTAVIIPLLIFSTAADLFSGERGDRTIKLTLTRPITRFNVYISKTLSIGVYVLINFIIVFIMSVICGLFLDRSDFNIGLLAQGLLAYATATIPMVFLLATATFLAQFFNNSGAAPTASILVYLTGKAVPFLSPIWAKVNPFSYTDWYLMWIGSAASTGRLTSVFIILLSSTMMLFALGFYIFDKRDY